MTKLNSTEAWREHARAAYAAGADERLGQATAAELAATHEIERLEQATSAWGALLSAWTAVADELANQARRAS